MAAAVEQRCQQCGRVGTRGFTTTPEQTVDLGFGPVRLTAHTECASRAACWRRRPKHHTATKETT